MLIKLLYNNLLGAISPISFLTSIDKSQDEVIYYKYIGKGGDKLKKTLTLILALLIMVLYPVSADENRSYKISEFNVEAKLNYDGSMDVKETIIYDFKGEFNGVYRTIHTEGSDGIENIHLYIGDSKESVCEDYSQKNNTYEILKESKGVKLKVYSKSRNESKKFTIVYRIKNVAVRYNDIAELYWKFMGKDTDVVIENFSVRISLPGETSKENIKAFAHGPLSGVVEIIDGQNVLLYVKELKPNNFVEARILFPTSLIENSHNIIEKNALSSILAEEGKWAEEANIKRQRARIFISISFIYALFEVLLIGFIYFKYDKEYKTTFKGPYYRELPGDYSPAVMSVLWNFGSIKPRDITATLMDLVRRKHIMLSQEVVRNEKLFGKKNDIDYYFTLNENSDTSQLSKHEAFFIDWMFRKIGSNNRVSLDDIEKYTKSRTGAMNFQSDYAAWYEYVRQEAKKYDFFDNRSYRGMAIGILFALLGIALAIFTLVAHENVLGFITTLITSIILLIYSITVRRRSKNGVLQYQMWKAFRKFLLHFSQLDKAEIPSVVVWEHYLVYAISLGVAKEVIKQLKMVFTEHDFNNRGLTYMYYGYYGHGINHFDALERATSSLTKTVESTYKQAVSKMSSSSGGGGGFSGGGGGGGGGGGAGAF